MGDVFTNDEVLLFIRPTLNAVAKISEVRFYYELFDVLSDSIVA
jgi:hypothetical protein